MSKKLKSKKQVAGQVAKRTFLDMLSTVLFGWVWVEGNSDVKKRKRINK